MIKKINKIKIFGIYNNYRFSNENTPEFKKFNLIYGWNYSGKTTLSRIFRSFELKDFSSGFESSEFEIEDVNGNKFSQSDLISNTLPIRVFNLTKASLHYIYHNPLLNIGLDNLLCLDNIEI